MAETGKAASKEAASKKAAAKENAPSRAGFFLALLVLALGVLIPPPAGWGVNVFRALGVFLFAIILWATEAMDPAATGLAVMVALPVLRILPYQDTMAGMGNVLLWRIVGIFTFTGAVQKTGLDRRLAYAVLRHAGGRVRPLFFLILMTSFLFVFLVPASMARTALMGAVAAGLMTALGLRHPSSLGKSIFIALPMVSLISSSGVIMGASVEIYAAGLFAAMAGYNWTYLSWLKVNLPIGLVTTVLMYPIFMALHPPEIDYLPGGRAVLDETTRGLGPMTGAEKKVLAVFAGLLAVWLLDLSDSFPAELLAALLLMVPEVGVLTWTEASRAVNWGAVVLFGSSLALARGLQVSGLVELASRAVLQWVGGWPALGLASVVFLLATLVRLGVANMTAVAATLLPLVLTLAKAVGLNPVWLGMICVVATSTGFFFPSQSPSSITTYALGYYTPREMSRAGALVSILFMAVTLAMAFAYWPLVGLPVRL